MNGRIARRLRELARIRRGEPRAAARRHTHDAALPAAAAETTWDERAAPRQRVLMLLDDAAVAVALLDASCALARLMQQRELQLVFVETVRRSPPPACQ